MQSELYILAYCEEMIPILVEIALDSAYSPQFTIIENMELEKGHHAIDVPPAQYRYQNLVDWQRSGPEKVAFSVVQPKSKQKVFEEFQSVCGLGQKNYPNLIHPRSFVSRTSHAKGGLIMEPMSVISVHTQIGFGVNIRRGVNIGHHGTIGDYVTINPGVSIGGNVRIGDRVTIGIGAILFDGIEIGSDTIIGAGSLVTRSIPAGVVAFGSPCEVRGTRDEVRGTR